MVAAATAKYRAEVTEDKADVMRVRQIVETQKDAARLAGLANPSRGEEFALAVAYTDGFLLGVLDASAE